MFESLTRFISAFDRESEYGEVISGLEEAIYAFRQDHPEFGLNHYYDILEKNGLKWDMDSMTVADVAKLDGKAVMALLMGAVRAERFCDGAFLGFCESGSVMSWLARLRELDEGAVYNEIR